MRKLNFAVAGAMALILAASCTDGNVTTPSRAASGRPSFTQVANAGYTTVDEFIDGTGHCSNGNPNVNCNIYDGKQYVWMNGGPLASSLGDGTYFFAVLSPSGQNNEVNDGITADPDKGTPHNLSDDVDAYTNRSFTIAAGVVTALGNHQQDGNKIRLFDYSNTLNPGGVYIMAVCKIQDAAHSNLYPVDPSSCKYDAFKVLAGTVCTTDCGPTGLLTIDKFYDSNGDGIRQNTEPLIIGWQVFDNFVEQHTPFSDPNAPAGDHVISEGIPTAPSSWFISHKDIGGANLLSAPVNLGTATATDLTVTASVSAILPAAVLFGDYCVRGSGGLTLGFWSNPNGKLVLGAHDPAWRTSLNDATNNGKLYIASASKNGTIAVSQYLVPTGAFSTAFSSFSSWLTGGQASTNGSALYMLSVQYAAMELNIAYEGTDPNAFYPPANETIGALMAQVKAELNAPTTRTVETGFITLLNGLNNGGSVIAAPGVCAVTF